MAITKIQSGAFPADVITSSAIDDLSVTHAKLHTTMDLSSKTVTLPTLSTLNTTGNVGIGTSSPDVALEIIGTTTSGIRIKNNELHSNGFNIYVDSTTDTAVLNNPFIVSANALS